MTFIYRDTHEVDLNQLTTLFNAVGWERRTVDRDRLAQLVHGSMYVVSAWDDDRLVGLRAPFPTARPMPISAQSPFCRSISDAALSAN